MRAARTSPGSGPAGAGHRANAAAASETPMPAVRVLDRRSPESSCPGLGPGGLRQPVHGRCASSAGPAACGCSSSASAGARAASASSTSHPPHRPTRAGAWSRPRGFAAALRRGRVGPDPRDEAAVAVTQPECQSRRPPRLGLGGSDTVTRRLLAAGSAGPRPPTPHRRPAAPGRAISGTPRFEHQVSRGPPEGRVPN